MVATTYIWIWGILGAVFSAVVSLIWLKIVATRWAIENEERTREREKALDFSSERQAILNEVSSATFDAAERNDLVASINDSFNKVQTSQGDESYQLSTKVHDPKDVQFSLGLYWAYVLQKPVTNDADPDISIGHSFDGGIDERQWHLVLTNLFSKSIQKVDRKIQGRILSAIDEIASDPISPKGNTIKPLVHEMKGLWRYRIGDYRLIYAPIERDRKVILLKFSARGDAYAA